MTRARKAKQTARRPRIPVREFEAALERCAGIPEFVALYLCHRLDTTVSSEDVEQAIAASPRLQACVEDASETLLDHAQWLLREAVIQGDGLSVRYFLSRAGADGGWANPSKIWKKKRRF